MKYQNILIGCVLIFRFSRIPYIPQKTSNTPFPENNREKLKHPSHFKFCVFLEFFKSNSGLQSINRKGKSSQKPNLWKNLPAWQGNFRQRIAMTNELSNRVEQNHCSGQCACKPSTKKLVDMSSNNNMIILVAVLITTASAIGLYVYLDTNSSEPINPQTGMLASEHRAPSSTAQGTASISMEELLEKKKQAVFSYSREGNFPDTRARLKNSFDDKTLTANEYYGELAHMLSISADAPASIIKEVLESGNKYGRDVLLGNLGSNLELPNSISAAERNAIFAW